MTTDTDAATRHEPTRTTYERYLRVPELLSLQKASEERLHPDELVFQVTHQTFELWWKITIELLHTAIHLLSEDRFEEAATALRRAVAAQDVPRSAMRQLELVAPADFLIMRRGLGDGNGGDSPGFRGILRAAPTLWEAFDTARARAGVPLVDLYAAPRQWPALYACAEALTDFDEQFHLFRAAHLKLAQRHIGLRSLGTGGTPMQALERTLLDLLFPDLWAARDALVARSSAEA